MYPLNGANKKLKQLSLASKAIRTARAIHKGNPIDVVHSFWLNRATEIGKKVAQALNVPIVATVMGQEMRHPNYRFEKWKKADFPIIAISAFQADALKRHDIDPKQVIPWGINPKFDSKTKDVDLVCVGSLIPLKNVNYFVELCSKLYVEAPHFRAIIIGDGSEKKQLEDQIQTRGLTSKIEMLGSLSYEETQNWIARSKVLVHPSDFEGFGMTIIEGLAYESHVVSTPVGIAKSLEIPHLIGDSQLDAAMLRILLKSNRPKSLVFDINETVEAYSAIYESVSKEREIDS